MLGLPGPAPAWVALLFALLLETEITLQDPSTHTCKGRRATHAWATHNTQKPSLFPVPEGPAWP